MTITSIIVDVFDHYRFQRHTPVHQREHNVGGGWVITSSPEPSVPDGCLTNFVTSAGTLPVLTASIGYPSSEKKYSITPRASIRQ